jgi:Pyruvate/2-oxoacid:ferredoxin oxidoreductase delta subunit
MDCICRKEHALRGHPCTHSSEVCLGFSKQPDMFENYPLGRRISKEEALKILAIAEEEGLVHNTFNVEQEPVFICNCCTCCCGIIQAVKAAKIPHLLAKCSFVASIDQETCTQCGVCADERCPIGAISEEDGIYRVLPERCIGCGVCTPTCPTDSITLVQKPESEQIKPPAHMVEWNLARAASRGIELKFE